MRTHNISIHYQRTHPKVDITNHGTFFTVDIKGENPQDHHRTALFFDTYGGVIAFKNSVLSSFNRLMKEAGYDK